MVHVIDSYYAQANNLGYTAMRATGSTDKEGNPTYATLGYCGNLKEVLVIVLRDAVQNHVKGRDMELRDALDFVEEQTDRIMKALEGVEI